MRRQTILPALLILTAGAAEAYVQATTEGFQAGAGRHRTDTANIQFLVNDQTAAGLTNRDGAPIISAGSDPMAALQAAASRWDSAPDSGLTFAPLTTTGLGIDGQDGMHVIHFADTDEARAVVGGALAIARSFSFASGEVVDSDIIFNPDGITFSTTLADETFDIGSVATHEIGHTLGLAHSGVAGATMFPRTPDGSDTNAALKEDELAFVRDIYPADGGVAGRFGSITGTISLGAALGATANGVFVTAVNQDTGAIVTTLSSVMNGTYRLGLLGPGNYLVSAEPVDGPAFRGDYSGANAGLLNDSVQDSFFGGNVAPTPVTVTAGGNNVADFAVGAGPPALSIEFIGRSAPNSPGAFMNLGPQALTLNPGDALDFVMSGPGLGAPIGDNNVRILNSNISIRPGSVLVDPFQMPNGNPLLRATIDVAADVAGIQLATIAVVKGDDAAIYTGGLVIQGAGGPPPPPPPPPPPSHEVTGVFDAAGFQDLISPGSIVAIGGEFTDQTAVASSVPLSLNLNGFSVTFNGLPGALFGVFEGDDFGVPFDQANVQVPWLLDTSAGTVDVVVNWDNGALSESARTKVSSAPFAANAAPASPGIFAIGLQAIVTNFSLAGDDVIPGSFAQPANSIPGVDNQPAAIGGVITIWCNGLGPVTPLPPTGAAPGSTLFMDKIIRVLVGGEQATVLGSVLHPDLVGLNQINAFVPEGVTPGDAVPIVIEVDCDGEVFRSRADVTIAVRPRP